MDEPSDCENPFCTRRITPGAIPFFFPPGQDPETLVDRLQQADWWGEIVGPHGSGKSALLAALTPAIERAGRQTVHVALHDGQRRLPLPLRASLQIGPLSLSGEGQGEGERLAHSPSRGGEGILSVIIVDGYEQLSYWSRLALKCFCRRRRAGLLVSAHHSVGLPALYQTAATPGLAELIVAELMKGRAPPFTPEDVSECLSRHGGNLREMLFDLYELYQKRRDA